MAASEPVHTKPVPVPMVCGAQAALMTATQAMPQATPPRHLLSCSSLYFFCPSVVASAFAFTSVGQPQPTASSLELGLHSSVEPLSQTRAFSTSVAY